jgi:hypothetical protein
VDLETSAVNVDIDCSGFVYRIENKLWAFLGGIKDGKCS